jgi:hypothetical protein
MGVRRSALVLLGLLATGAVRAQSSDAARRIVDTMLTHEGDPAEHRLKYMYLLEERSDRTGGHVWTERVVETPMGKVRLLLAEEAIECSAARGSESAVDRHCRASRRISKARTGDEERRAACRTDAGVVAEGVSI